MTSVALKLAELSLEMTDEHSKDVFGRSSYNRFYYATFLITREMLSKMDSKWPTAQHSQIPDIIKDSVKKKIKTALQNSKKSKLLSYGEANRLDKESSIASQQLSQLLKTAYEVRIIADYWPLQKIEILKGHFKLLGYTNTEAGEWPKRANAYCKTLLNTWNSLALPRTR